MIKEPYREIDTMIDDLNEINAKALAKLLVRMEIDKTEFAKQIKDANTDSHVVGIALQTAMNALVSSLERRERAVAELEKARKEDDSWAGHFPKKES